jgi:hypothetical protein
LPTFVVVCVLDGSYSNRGEVEMVSKLKRPSTQWENIFASYTSDKGLITRIHRELKKLTPPKKSMTQ